MKLQTIFIASFALIIAFSSCEDDSLVPPTGDYIPPPQEEEESPPAAALHTVDLSNWKVTLPIGNPTEVHPPEILNYANIEVLQEFMYDDHSDSSLVFYTYPGASTANSSYSRTELREQMVPGSNSTNWTFAQGGRLKGTLSLEDISTKSDGEPHQVIIMQIHGRLTNAQRDLIGEDDNNAPPVLKIFWRDGRVRVKVKQLKDINVSDTESLYTDAWEDDDGRYFAEQVNNEKFTLEVIVTEGRMEVTMNNSETFVYEDIHMQRWGIFENYFKAGNYLVTTDEDAFCLIKYYDLEVSH